MWIYLYTLTYVVIETENVLLQLKIDMEIEVSFDIYSGNPDTCIIGSRTIY